MKYYKIVILTCTVLLFGSPVKESDSYIVASNVHKQYNIESNRNDFNVIDVEIIRDLDLNIIYIYHLDPVGFIIISADDRLNPYFAYSFESNFKTTNMPSNIKYVFNSYKTSVLNAIESNIERTGAIKQSWDRFTNIDFTRTYTRDISPLIDAEFDQSGAWNNYLSQYGFYGPVGCVAVAMSQIMHYWQYPEQGEGSNTYIENDLGELTADFYLTTYNFNVMQPTYATSASQLLLFHTGVSVNMDYANDGSGAQTDGVYPSSEDAYVRFFKYSDNIDNIDLENFDTAEEFRAIIKEQLENHKPVLYTGFDSSDYGHAWNVDGYQGNNLHCNWGWGGWNNGYFSTISMNGLNQYQSALIDIIPDPYTSPMALFEYEISDDTVIFIDLSSLINESEIESWNWDFGDGTITSNASSYAEHTYSTSGEFSISLTVTNIYGETGEPHVESITIGNDIVLGDINFDNVINVLDIVLLVNYVLDSTDVSGDEFFAADLNNDGVLNVLDIVSLVNFILNS